MAAVYIAVRPRQHLPERNPLPLYGRTGRIGSNYYVIPASDHLNAPGLISRHCFQAGRVFYQNFAQERPPANPENRLDVSGTAISEARRLLADHSVIAKQEGMYYVA